MSTEKKIFMQKNIGSTLYKWSPPPNDLSKRKIGSDKKPSFCNAIAGSNGQDWVSNYSYEMEVINYQQTRIAYFECDYVE